MSIKAKTISGLKWSFIDIIVKQGVLFIIGIVLARLLSPKEFGLVGMITIFIAISQTFIDSGFRQALIRKKSCTQAEYCTVFYFNTIIGLAFYLILFFSASFIADFFDEPKLTLLIRVLGVVLIIKSLSLIQEVILIKQVNFKLLTKISLFSSFISGVIGVGMAYNGYGVWSLIGKVLVSEIIKTISLWIYNGWRANLIFSKNAFKELFGFGYKVLLNSLMGQIYNQVYNAVIAKFYSAEALGFFTRAEYFKNLPSATVSNIIQRVTLPVLAHIQDKPQELKTVYKKLVMATMLITFSLMIGLAAVADNLVVTLIGKQWEPSVVFLQLLCFAGMFYPLHHFNYSILNLKGRSDLVLKGNVIMKIFAVPIIMVGIFYGIVYMIIGMIINTTITYFIFTNWSGKQISYPVRNQLLDIAPSFLIAAFMGISVFLIGTILPWPKTFILGFQIILGGVIVVSLTAIFNKVVFEEIKSIIVSQLKSKMQDL